MNSQPQPLPKKYLGFFVRLKRFWQRLTEGLELSELWKQFRADARASYRFYQRDFDARVPKGSRRHNFLHTIQEFGWAILEKLTPARRVLLLLGFVLLVFPSGAHGDFWGGVLLFIVLMLEVADRVVMKRDLEIARDIQRWLLPSEPPPIPGLAIAFAFRPANTVAGDFYDVFSRPVLAPAQPRFLLAVADVAGKSIPAALLMATFQASLKTISATPCSLADLISGMNRYACTNSQSGLRFTTAFLAEIDPATLMLTYINAGHNAPILRRSSGVMERLTSGGLPLGIQGDATYESGHLALTSGDWLIIFTDGLIEAVDGRDQDYGQPRLLNLLQKGNSTSPEELLRQIMGDLETFIGATPQHDDVTCMLVKVE